MVFNNNETAIASIAIIAALIYEMIKNKKAASATVNGKLIPEPVTKALIESALKKETEEEDNPGSN